MKTYSLLIVLSAFFFFGCSTAQIKKDKMEATQEKVSDPIGDLLASQNFEFIANTMFPMGQPSKNLVGDGYSVTFSPEKIVSDLPYYGVAHRGMGVGRDKGMRFEGEPIDFAITRSKNEYRATAVVKNDTDSFFITVEVSNSGYATLNIDSKNRETISYQGEVRALR